MKWILGSTSSSHWHLAAEKPCAFQPGRTHVVTACAGKQIGGAFGPTTFTGMPSEIEHARCKRCEAIALAAITRAANRCKLEASRPERPRQYYLEGGGLAKDPRMVSPVAPQPHTMELRSDWILAAHQVTTNADAWAFATFGGCL